ncbi:dinitrogenase iron-molybdenum cofactor biosynthesis protein [Maridesulfovibrio sp.]|uniref:NifB/NifX family molybdenum-iron cluster-binding protein n=1 Tax=Maridesulfovibrio sp. TaxID=2795000 RepID=UPI002A188269|nr:dinitrogenase iron-molybdenum cofactor biosynthesis protein [Maridesulfovibrio sp.]
MPKKLLIPLLDDDVAPRFDLATDVMLIRLGRNSEAEERIIVLPQASADDLCALATSEKSDTVICGGIDEEHFQYLKWKGIHVFDDVIGPVTMVLESYKSGQLTPGMNFHTGFNLAS